MKFMRNGSVCKGDWANGILALDRTSEMNYN